MGAEKVSGCKMENRIIGHRKFIFAMFCVLTNSLLAAFGKIDPGVYSVVSVAIIGAYITGNVFQNVNTKKEEKVNQ